MVSVKVICIEWTMEKSHSLLYLTPSLLAWNCSAAVSFEMSQLRQLVPCQHSNRLRRRFESDRLTLVKCLSHYGVRPSVMFQLCGEVFASAPI
jgi:hypothetical protein